MITTSVTFNCGCGFKRTATDFKSLKQAVGDAIAHGESFGHSCEIHGLVKVDKSSRDFRALETVYERPVQS